MNTTIIFIIFTKSLLFILLRIVGTWIMARSLWRVYKESRCCFLKTTELQQRQQHRLSLSTPTSTSCWSQKFSSLIQNRTFGHYQQQEGEENTSISSSTSSSSVVNDRNATADAVEGILIGRIIPRRYLDYTKTKPYQRRAENELHWKDLVEQYIIQKKNKDIELFRNADDTKEEEDSDSEKEEDQVVVLDIKFETTVLLEGGEKIDGSSSSNNNNNKQSSSPIINVQLHMQRKPNETANRTLRRMELSIQRKIIQGYRYGSSSLMVGGQRSGIHVIRESSIASNNNDINDFAPTSRITINNMGGGSGSVQNQSYVGENDGRDDENASDDNSDDDLDGYRDDFDLSSSTSSSTATTRTSSSGSVEEEEEEDRCYRKFNVSNTITIDDLLRKLNEYQDEVHHHHRGAGGISDDDEKNEGGSRTASMLYMDGLIVDNDHNIVAAPTATTTGSCHHHHRHQNRISLQIESLPPTILKVQTFEDFKANVFVGIPLVVETRVLHSSRKRPLIVWFVNNDIVSFDCNSYTPTMDDFGKQISVYVMPLHLHDDDDDDNDSSNRGGRCNNGNNDGGCGTTGIDRFLTNHQNVVYEVYQYENLVEQRPNLPIIERRLAWLPRSSSSQPGPTNNCNNNNVLRVMSYNLLADEYAKREVDQQLMYGHCQEKDIVKTRRMPLLVYEILIHQPDIVCLQEVDSDVYKRLLFPVLESQGYNGYYSPKVSAQLEGCAMFWNLNVFQKEPLRQEQFALRDLVKNSDKKAENDDDGNDDDSTTWSSTKDIRRLLDLKPDLQKVVNEKVGQVFQVASLRLKDPSWETKDEKKKNRVAVVGNTHLFYHPLAHHIRLIQMYAICMQIDRSRRQAAKDGASIYGEDDDDSSESSSPSRTIRPTTTASSLPPFIICGDMNADPLSGCVRLLMNRMVESYHHETWKFLHEYSWEQGEEDFLLEHGFIGNDVGDVPVYQDEAFRDAMNLEDNEKKEQQQREEEVDSSLLTSSSLPQAQPLQRKLRDINPPMIVLPASFPEIELGYEVIPEFTNYAVDFAETLDYIFASKPSTDVSSGFELLSSASVPSKREMRELCVAMPNANMPSDHVSIACDFKWVVDE